MNFKKFFLKLSLNIFPPLFFNRILELEEGNKLFIAVGASHLAGKNGLLNLFQDAGYSLKPLAPFIK